MTHFATQTAALAAALFIAIASMGVISNVPPAGTAHVSAPILA